MGNIANYQPQMFSDYTPDTITSALRKISHQANSNVTLSAEFAALEQSQVQIRFSYGNTIDFICPQQFSSEERKNFYTNRWISCWTLFSHVKMKFPDLRGTCSLWVDDIPSGPGLSFCGNNASNVLIPDCAFFQSNGYLELRDFCRDNWRPWRDRKTTCFWRGTSTGSRTHLRVRDWQDLPRMALCRAVKQIDQSNMFDVGISRIVQIDEKTEISQIEAEELVKPEVPLTEFMNYRLGIDIDGNTCSWPGLFSKLLMGVTTLKIESIQGWRQWYYDRLLPWKNFVPISSSLKDLAETVSYLAAHPGEAERIAHQGQQIANSLTLASVLEDTSTTIFNFVSC